MLNGLVSVPHFKDHRFSTRRDVINKTVFRIMKRYYLQLFKNMFPKMKLKVNSVDEYLEASKQLLSSLSGDVSVNESLKFFITQMVSTKLASQFSISQELKDSLKLLDACLYSYSDKALKRVFADSSARLLFSYFYEHGQKFFSDQKNVQKNSSEYQTMFESLYKSFNGQNSM